MQSQYFIGTFDGSIESQQAICQLAGSEAEGSHSSCIKVTIVSRPKGKVNTCMWAIQDSTNKTRWHASEQHTKTDTI